MTAHSMIPDGSSSPVDPVAREATRLMSDTRYDWLRSKGRRRGLVVAAALAVVGVAWACLIDWPVLVVLALAPAVASWWVLQRVVRGFADLPDEYVDERVRQVRNEHYRRAYLGIVALTSAVLLVLYLGADATRVGWQIESRHLHALFWTVTLSAAMLPSALLAWTEHDI